MQRLRNKLTGVVVSVDDDTAAQLGREFEPVQEPARAKRPATAKK